MSFSLYAQSPSVTIPGSFISIKAAFNIIEEQTHYNIAYNSDLLDISKKIRISLENATIEDALDSVLYGLNVTYEIAGRRVFIVPVKKIEDVIYTGKVFDEFGETVSGANIFIKETKKGTVTNNQGVFEVEAPVRSTLQVTFIGYDMYEIQLINQQPLYIFLNQHNEELKEVIAVGYGEQQRRDVSSSISSLNVRKLEHLGGTSIEQALTGRMAGVQVIQPNATPGAGLDMLIRGRGTITAGSSPLYVVDGIPLDDMAGNTAGFLTSPLTFLSTNDIKSIEILKDASACAIYGSRGAGGVVLVTTTGGFFGKPRIQYRGQAGVQKISSKIDVLNAYEYAGLVYEAHNAAYYEELYKKGLQDLYDPRASNLQRWKNLHTGNINLEQPYMIPDNIWDYINGVQGLTDTNWQDAILRTGLIHKHHLSIAGGNNTIRFSVSGNYHKEEGIVICSDFEKMGFRTKLDIVQGKWHFGGNITINRSIYNLVNTEGRYADDGVLSAALGAAPVYPVYDPDGRFNYDHYNLTFGQSKINNPVAIATLIEDNIQAFQLLGSGYIKYKILSGLSLKTQGSWNLNNNVREYYRPAALPNFLNHRPPSIPEASTRTENRLTWMWENTAEYKTSFNKYHKLNVVLGWTAQRFRGHSTYLIATDLPKNDILQTIPTAATASYISTSTDEWALLSALGRMQYSLKGRYLISSAIRRDGSSRFAVNNKWGTFPSVSGAWYLTEESFMEPLAGWISSLKMRASWGKTGNMSIGNYAFYGKVSGQNYSFGNELATGMAESSWGNPDITWEKTSQVNLGMELELFRFLNIELDLYKGITSDMLLDVPVPHYSGFTNVLQNIGKLQNKGVEFTISTNNQFGNVRLSNTFNIAANRNKVLSLGEGISEIISQSNKVIDFITRVGEPFGNYYTYVVDGIYQSQQEIDQDIANGIIIPNARPGDFRFKKFGNDPVLDENDKAITGNYLPDFTYGFSCNLEYKGFDFALSLQGVQGNQIANINRRYLANMEGNANQLSIARDRWRSKEHPGNGNVYRANRSATGMNSVISSWHIEDGSYLRISEITFGYSIPKAMLSRLSLTSLRMYISASNLFTFTKYSGYNPEVSADVNPVHPGVDYGTYPLAKSFIIGLNFSI